jgi:hypothetical protein
MAVRECSDATRHAHPVHLAQTGHRSTTVVRRYSRDGSLFRENAAVVGL